MLTFKIKKIYFSHFDLLRKMGYLLLGSMLIFPFKFQLLKAGLLMGILLYSIILIAHRNMSISIPKKIIQWIFIYIFANIFYICYGLFLNNPAPLQYFNVYFTWPLLLTFILMLVDKNTFYGIIKCMRYSLLIILLLGSIAFIKFNLEFIEDGSFLGFTTNIRHGYPFIAIAGGSVTSVIFLYFFFLSFCLLESTHISKIDWINTILGIFFIFFTSRRSLFFNFILSFILSGIFLFFLKKKERDKYLPSLLSKGSKIISLVIITFLIIYFFDLFDLSLFMDFVNSAVGDDNSDPRIAQTSDLLNGWKENPILGNGTGISANNNVISELPGTYELTYLAMLFERGLIGITVFWILYFFLNYWGIKTLKKGIITSSYIISMLVALNLFMLANATNPYLGAFDHIIFLLMLFTVLKISNKKENENLYHNKSL